MKAIQMTPDEILREFARKDIFPKAAMAAAREDPETMTPIFVDIVRRLSVSSIKDMDDRDVMALIPVIHLLGEWRAQSAYRPFINMLRQPTRKIEYLLGDAITETSFRVVAGTFNGELEPLFEAIEDPKADQFARGSLLSALVLIARSHPETRTKVEDFVRSFLPRNAEASEDVLTSWKETVIDLGLQDMTETVREFFDVGRVPPDYCGFDDFLENLQATLDGGGTPFNRPHQTLISDAIEELSNWHCYTDAYFAEKKRRKVSNEFRVAPWLASLAQSAAKVGRNDPCPCGSGKKFKKCCLH